MAKSAALFGQPPSSSSRMNVCRRRASIDTWKVSLSSRLYREMIANESRTVGADRTT